MRRLDAGSANDDGAGIDGVWPSMLFVEADPSLGMLISGWTAAVVA